MAMELRRNMAINFGTIAICTLVLLADLRVTCVVVVRKKEPHTFPPKKKNYFLHFKLFELFSAVRCADRVGRGRLRALLGTHHRGHHVHHFGMGKTFFTCGKAVRS